MENKENQEEAGRINRRNLLSAIAGISMIGVGISALFNAPDRSGREKELDKRIEKLEEKLEPFYDNPVVGQLRKIHVLPQKRVNMLGAEVERPEVRDVLTGIETLRTEYAAELSGNRHLRSKLENVEQKAEQVRFVRDRMAKD